MKSEFVFIVILVLFGCSACQNYPASDTEVGIAIDSSSGYFDFDDRSQISGTIYDVTLLPFIVKDNGRATLNLLFYANDQIGVGVETGGKFLSFSGARFELVSDNPYHYRLWVTHLILLSDNSRIYSADGYCDWGLDSTSKAISHCMVKSAGKHYSFKFISDNTSYMRK